MINLSKKIATAVATGTLLMSLSTPAAFAATVTVSGNSAFSVNLVNLTKFTSKTVSQGSSTVVTNVVTPTANSGGNTSSFNTGPGASTVVSGAASNTVNLTATGGSNVYTQPACGCVATPSTFTVSGNGPFSVNGVTVNATNVASTTQSSATQVTNVVTTTANSGNNSSVFNTGGGSTVVSGPASNTVTTTVTGGSNVSQ